MNKVLFATLLTSVSIVAGGCLSGGNGGVAVIDLDRVATAMGWLDELSKSIQTTDTELRSQLDEVQKISVRTIEEKKKELAVEAKLTEEETKTLLEAKEQREIDALPLSKVQRDVLMDTVNKANASWQKTMNDYQQALQGRRSSLILSYREKVRPAARRVATERGLNIVVTTGDSVLCFDQQTADITDKVIDELQKTFGVRKLESTVQQQQAPAAKPVAAKPAAAKPTASKPTAAKSPVSAKPMTSKPAVAKPVDAEATDTESAEPDSTDAK